MVAFKDGQCTCAWLDSRADEAISLSGKPDDRGCSLEGKNSKGVQFRQSLRLVGEDRLVVELFKVLPDGGVEVIMSLEMDRLEIGERSAAAEHFERSPLLARLRGGEVASANDK